MTKPETALILRGNAQFEGHLARVSENQPKAQPSELRPVPAFPEFADHREMKMI